MIILIGKSTSGKDTVCNQLIKKGYKKLVTYTTRPIRKGEVQDQTYHFISEEDFNSYIVTGYFAEYRSYNTVNGTWYYGSAVDDYCRKNDHTVVILSPSGLKQVMDNDFLKDERIISFYIYSNLKTIKKRLKQRGDNKEEAQRRIESDIEDFAGIESKVSKIIYNNDGTDINEVVDKIIAYVEELN